MIGVTTPIFRGERRHRGIFYGFYIRLISSYCSAELRSQGLGEPGAIGHQGVCGSEVANPARELRVDLACCSEVGERLSLVLIVVSPTRER